MLRCGRCCWDRQTILAAEFTRSGWAGICTEASWLREAEGIESTPFYLQSRIKPISTPETCRFCDLKQRFMQARTIGILRKNLNKT